MTASTRTPSTILLRLGADGSLVTVDGLRPAVAALPLEPGHHVVVDVSGVDLVGERVQQVLAAVHRRVDLVRGTLELRSPSAPVLRLLRGVPPRHHRSLTA
ncbi:MAG TPA: STAS domain-containing protein [Jiangellales bacterium]|nr:STAS domain-containing protein [Jiangellales bacterium]